MVSMIGAQIVRSALDWIRLSRTTTQADEEANEAHGTELYPASDQMESGYTLSAFHDMQIQNTQSSQPQHNEVPPYPDSTTGDMGLLRLRLGHWLTQSTVLETRTGDHRRAPSPRTRSIKVRRALAALVRAGRHRLPESVLSHTR